MMSFGWQTKVCCDNEVKCCLCVSCAVILESKQISNILISVESNTIRAAVRWPSQLRPFRIVGVAVTCRSLCVLLGILLFQRKRLANWRAPPQLQSSKAAQVTQIRRDCKYRMKQERLRRETQEKYERSLCTPAGLKTFRLQPSIDNTSIMKYQSRPSSTSSSAGQSPRHTSTPHPPAPTAQRSSSAGRTTGARSQGTRSIGTQTSLERASSAGAVREKPPAPDNKSRDRTGSSLSNHSVTFTSRSSSCQPTRMYQSESIRTAAKLNRPPSKVYMCQEERDRARSPGLQRAKSPSRIDGTPVELPGFMKSNYYLHHEDLSMGQKQYIWGVARIYSVTQLMSLKQRQYQNLLDYEFSRRIQNKELKEHERVKEWKDYQRYSRFIKRYEQRIPRNKLNPARSPCEEASHVHRHMIKGWTTDPHANEAYRPSSKTSYGAKQRCPGYHPDSSEDTEQQESTDNETEEYRLRLIILPGEKEESGTQGDNAAESGEMEQTNSSYVEDDDKQNVQSENVDVKESLEKTEDKKEAEAAYEDDSCL